VEELWKQKQGQDVAVAAEANQFVMQMVHTSRTFDELVGMLSQLKSEDEHLQEIARLQEDNESMDGVINQLSEQIESLLTEAQRRKIQIVDDYLSNRGKDEQT
ncbi:MAG: hypothetical protein EZS28_053432, partial [Streblomastix strix]